MFLKIACQSFSVIAGSLGDYYYGVCFTTFIGRAEFAGNGFGIGFDLGYHDCFCAARDTRNECNVPAVSPHDFNQESTMVRGCRYLQTVYSFQSDIECGIYTDCHFRTREVIVNRGSYAHHRKASLGQRMCSCLRTISANDNQRLNVMVVKNPQSPYLSALILELFTSSAAQNSTAPLDDTANRPCPQGHKVASNEPGEPLSDTKHFQARGDPGSHDRADGRIHSWRVTATG